MEREWERERRGKGGENCSSHRIIGLKPSYDSSQRFTFIVIPQLFTQPRSRVLSLFVSRTILLFLLIQFFFFYFFFFTAWKETRFHRVDAGTRMYNNNPPRMRGNMAKRAVCSRWNVDDAQNGTTVLKYFCNIFGATKCVHRNSIVYPRDIIRW